MKRVKIISDITFDLIANKIDSKNFVISDIVYSDSIISTLLSSKDQFKEIDFLVIHFDTFFHRYNEEFLVTLLKTIESISSSFIGNILISNNFISVEPPSFLKKNIGQDTQFVLSNGLLLEKIINISNIFMYDFNRSVFGLGIDRSYNFNLGHLYQMPYTKELIDVVTYQIKAYLDFLILPERKAIFLDCDNTLWNGIVGEDGVNGIRCDKNSEGIVYYYFQQFLLKKKKEGFLLCLCSKNNEDEVKNAFEELNMPLKWADFIIKKINWEDKPNNLKAAANELNIGTESFIFIDDSDFELQYVNSILPEIKILKFEKNYKQFLNLIDDFAFKRKVLTPEDFEKNKQYIAEKERKELQINSISFDRYLKSLEIKLEISVNNLNDLVRLSQLTEKTNQFNFNKEHFSVKQLEEFIKDNNLIYSLKVSDKFSDYGTVGLILIEVKGEKAVLRNYLMSCRALGRNIENDFFQNVKILLKDKKIEIDSIIFNESSKNEPAKQFYQKIKNER